MDKRECFCRFSVIEQHKGFYNDEDPVNSLLKILYTDFWELPDDDEFPYGSAYSLLLGSCNHFVVALRKIFGYSAYIIEGQDGKGFHAFCQIYSNNKWFYVDARGITSSFNEFMEIASTFVGGEYIIRPIELEDIKKWEEHSDYNDVAYAFAEAIIDRFRECYTL